MACSLSELAGLAVVALLLFSMSNRVQYYTKMFIFIVSALISACVPIPLMLPWPKDHRNALIPAWCIVKIGELIGTSFEIQGTENLVRDKGSVVLINHQSAIDLIGEKNFLKHTKRPSLIFICYSIRKSMANYRTSHTNSQKRAFLPCTIQPRMLAVGYNIHKSSKSQVGIKCN